MSRIPCWSRGCRGRSAKLAPGSLGGAFFGGGSSAIRFPSGRANRGERLTVRPAGGNRPPLEIPAHGPTVEDLGVRRPDPRRHIVAVEDAPRAAVEHRPERGAAEDRGAYLPDL